MPGDGRGRLSDFYPPVPGDGGGNVELGTQHQASRRISTFVPAPEGPPGGSSRDGRGSSEEANVERYASSTAGPVASPIYSNFFASSNSAAYEEKDVDPPDFVSVELWRKLKICAEDSFRPGDCPTKDVLNKIAEFANKYQPPTGFGDAELWKVIVQGAMAAKTAEELRKHNDFCKNTHRRFLDAEEKFKARGHSVLPPMCKSRVFNFFLDFSDTDFNVDSAINAFALVNALILTIPFGVLMSLDHSWLKDFREAVAGCPQNSSVFRYMQTTVMPILSGNDLFTSVYTDLVGRLSGSVYFSMMGLILSTLYYIFSPSDKSVLTSNGSMRQRILIVVAFAFTVGSITYLLMSWSTLINIFMRDYDVPAICDAPSLVVSDTVTQGVVAVFTSLAIGLICMY